MAYFLLQKGFELCDWKGLPFGLRYPNLHYTDFFDKESYRVVYALDEPETNPSTNRQEMQRHSEC